jgi:hypothetical protein
MNNKMINDETLNDVNCLDFDWQLS